MVISNSGIDKVIFANGSGMFGGCFVGKIVRMACSAWKPTELVGGKADKNIPLKESLGVEDKCGGKTFQVWAWRRDLK